ncbi:hypothetical protein SISSUDRAFT_540242 [Sistotremastrum suecicum HHB10207 ss-3]|uniref:Uncharacterized protein n=1 Tax=Sistotremastrum suecicum HHB10207 ss-3 TaxID=1314776 RepID=A0A166F154_9AGAM|nr:hypothetical protein SISSUDRAFT_540242 [Sistotremastrum suecicum HHB10207 ss-3]
MASGSKLGVHRVGVPSRTFCLEACRDLRRIATPQPRYQVRTSSYSRCDTHSPMNSGESNYIMGSLFSGVVYLNDRAILPTLCRHMHLGFPQACASNWSAIVSIRSGNATIRWDAHTADRARAPPSSPARLSSSILICGATSLLIIFQMNGLLSS